MALRKHVYFKDENVYNHVINQRNSSAYIEELVLQDMNNSNKYITLEDVKRFLEEYQLQPKSDMNDNFMANSISSILNF